jgi:hypothetical protein
MTRLQCLAGVAVAGGLLASSSAWARPVSYVILKEGEPIGHESVAIDRAGDQTTVQVDTETRVKVLFLDFHYKHHRVETWQGGELQRMVADTDDDGAIHHLEAQRSGDQIHLTVDGTHQDIAADALPLTLWSKAILDHPNLYSIIDAQPYRVTVKDLGSAPVAHAGQDIPAERFRMSGDIDRDLWYGSDGLLVKVAFERRGYPIEIVRE